jgi:hypothetical protein
MGTAQPRPPAQRAAENAGYNRRRASAGLAKVTVLVPLVRLGELDALLVQWREEARAQLNSDQPSADEILLIHGICRVRRLKLPVSAFATRHTAEAWIQEQQLRLDDRQVETPRRRVVT